MRIARLLLLTLLVTAVPAFADTSLTVMSFNIRFGTANDGENAWEHRKDILIDAIKASDPDILGTQECLDFQAEYIVEHLPQYRWFGVGRNEDGTGEIAAVFYKKNLLMPIHTGNFWLSEMPDVPGSKSWDADITRIVTHAEFYHRQTKQKFYFYNTHFDHRGKEARLQSAKMLHARAKSLPANAPIIVTGDFNARGGDSEPWQAATDGLFRDAWLNAKTTKGPSVTFSGFGPPDANRNARIDWILLGGPITPHSCETIVYNKDGRYPSDHLPVVAKVTIAGP